MLGDQIRAKSARFASTRCRMYLACAVSGGFRRLHTASPPPRPASPSGSKLDFNKDVQPILASNCFSCHGPDPEMRKAGLRLDLEESAFKKRPGKPDAIVPGRPESSELVKRIESKSIHTILMPQTSLGEAKPMKPQEIAILKEMDQGGRATTNRTGPLISRYAPPCRRCTSKDWSAIPHRSIHSSGAAGTGGFASFTGSRTKPR